MNLPSELKKLRKAASEAVRRGVEYADWEAECVPHLAYRDGDPPDRLDKIFCDQPLQDDVARCLRQGGPQDMKPHEIKICLGALAAGVVLLTSLWGFLLSTLLYHKAGIAKVRIIRTRPPPTGRCGHDEILTDYHIALRPRRHRAGDRPLVLSSRKRRHQSEGPLFRRNWRTNVLIPKSMALYFLGGAVFGMVATLIIIFLIGLLYRLDFDDAHFYADEVDFNKNSPEAS